MNEAGSGEVTGEEKELPVRNNQEISNTPSRERQTPSSQLELASALITLPEKDTYLEQKRVAAFQEYWIRSGKPPELFEKVMANIRFITPDNLQHGIHNMATWISDFVCQGESYYLAIDHKKKSGGYIASMLEP